MILVLIILAELALFGMFLALELWTIRGPSVGLSEDVIALEEKMMWCGGLPTSVYGELA